MPERFVREPHLPGHGQPTTAARKCVSAKYDDSSLHFYVLPGLISPGRPARTMAFKADDLLGEMQPMCQCRFEQQRRFQVCEN